MSRIYPYAGFWRRAVALLIDSIIISIPGLIIYALIMLSVSLRLAKHQELLHQSSEAGAAGVLAVMGGMLLFQIAFLVFFWLYFALLESGKKQATFGKRAMGIKVVGADGGRISFVRATGRLFGKYVSGVILNFGYCMAGFTKKRQALHDLMADTYVVQDEFQPGQEKPVLEFSVGGLIASICASLAPVILFFMGIFFALLIPALIDSDSAQDDFPLSKKTEAQLSATLAKTEMLLFAMEGDKSLPKTKDDIAYSKTKDGYRAEFTDEDGQRFVLLNKKGEYGVCCAEGACELIEEKKCN